MAEAAVLAYRQWRLERRMFWRNPTAAFFSFILPLLFLFLFGAIFSGDQSDARRHRAGHPRHERHVDDVQRSRDEHHLPARGGRPQAHPRHPDAADLLPGRRRRQRRVQRRRAGRDRRAGRASSSSASAGPRTGSSSPSSASSASSTLAALGVAFSHVIPNFDAAPAYTNIVFLPVIFISGVFYDVDNAPQFLRDVAQVLPLTHIIDGALGGARHGRAAGRQRRRTWRWSWPGAWSARSSRCAGSAGSPSGIRR